MSSIKSDSPSLYFKDLLRLVFKNTVGENFLRKEILADQNSRWKKMIPPHYLYKPGSIRNTTINGVRYLFDISNQTDHFIYFGQEESGYRSIEKEIRHAAIIFDIGANNAGSTLFFASLNPTASIYSFEPHPVTYQKAVKNISLNAFQNIQLFDFGFGNAECRSILHQADKSNDGMNRIMSNGTNVAGTEIQIKILDAFVTANNIDNISLIKIDVEGYELEVLKGAEQTLKKYHPALFIELDDDNLKNNDASAAALIQFLLNSGYQEIRQADTMRFIAANEDFSHCHIDIIAKV